MGEQPKVFRRSREAASLGLSFQIRARISSFREERGWSYGELGARLKPPVSKMEIYRLERGKKTITVELLAAIARVFGFKLSELLPEDEVDVPTDKDTKQFLGALHGLPKETRHDAATAAIAVVQMAQRLAAQQMGLPGNPELAEEFVSAWVSRDDEARRRLVDIIKVAG